MRLETAARGYAEGRRGLLARGRSRHRHSPQQTFRQDGLRRRPFSTSAQLVQYRRLLLSPTLLSGPAPIVASREPTRTTPSAKRWQMELLMPFGVQICSGTEWAATTGLLNVSPSAIGRFPYGEFLDQSMSGRDCVFFNSRRTKTRAAGACQYAIDRWRVDPLIVLGTCGGVAEHLSVGDLIVATRTFQYDFQDRRPEMGYGLQAGLSWFCPGQFAGTLHPGTLASADHDLTFRDLPELRRENVLGADWESGAIATVCALNGIRWTIVRGVSDVPLCEGSDDAARQVDDYRRHTAAIMERLLRLLPQIVAAMAA